MSTETILKIVIALIFVAVLGTPLFYIPQSVYPYTLSKTLFFQTVVELILAFWLVLVGADRRYLPKPTPALIALAVFVGALLLTAFLGIDPWRSFWSTYNRAFGVFALLHLAALTLVLSSIGKRFPWRALLYISLGITLIIDALALRQIISGEIGGGRPGASLGSPATLAGYLLFHVLLGIYLLLESRKFYRQKTGELVEGAASGGRLAALANGVRLTFLVFTLVANVGIILFTQTRGDILGLVAAVLVLTALFIFRPPPDPAFLSGRKLYVAVLVCALIFVGGFWFTRGSISWSHVPGLSRFSDISLGGEALLPRIAAARAAWLGFLEHPVLGAGWDNFNVVYDKYYDPKVLRLNYTETHFDKPHNFFLEDLSVGGAFLALAHLALFVLFILAAFKMRDRLLGQIFIAATAGYIVRNLFVFNALGTDLLFYVFLGYAASDLRFEVPALEDQPAQVAVSKKKFSAGYLAAALMVSAIFAYVVNIRSIKAASFHLAGLLYADHNEPVKAAENFEKALNIWSPYAWNFAREYAVTMAGAYYQGKVVPEKVVLEAAEKMEQVAKEHPLDAQNHYALTDIYNQISGIAPEEFLGKAEQRAAIALKLSPNRQQIFFALAKTKALKGDLVAAVELARAALLLDEEVADSHFYYGLFSFMNGDKRTARLEIEKALELGKEKTINLKPILEELGIAY